MPVKIISLLMILALLLMIPGCYDYQDPDEVAWALAVGLDKGRQNTLTMTAVVAIPKNVAGGGGGKPASGGGGEGDGKFLIVSMEVPTLLSALELLNTVVDRRIDLSHTKWVVFSRELAEQDISRYLAPLARFRQFRPTTDIVVSQGRADDLLKKGVPVLEDNVGKYYELLHRGWRYTEFVPLDTFHQFYYKAKSPGMAPIAMLASTEKEDPVFPDNSPKPKGKYEAGSLPRKGGAGIEVMGAAVFNGGRMIGTLDGNSTGVAKMLADTFVRAIVDIPDPRHPGMYVITEVKLRRHPEINVMIGDDGLPEISADVHLEGDIISIQSGEKYESPEQIPFFEQEVNLKLQNDLEQAVAKSLEWGVDFPCFGRHAKKLFRTWQEWEDYNWNEKYSRARVSVAVDYKVRRIGLLHETVPVRTYPR
ncbi:MAG: Ger(x)C family spore germination protein [Eubacteriales bacterium]